MTAIIYTAKRSLMSGHTANTEYSFDIGMQQIDRKISATRITKKSLSGVAGYYLQRVETLYAFQTIPLLITDTLCKNMREFLDSTVGGESFDIDPYGTVITPDADFTAQLETTEYQEQRLGTTDYVTFSFTVRAIA